MSGFPLLVLLDGRRCVVVGGGRVAERKVAALVEAGARVRVVSPVLTAELEGEAEAGRIEVCRRPYRAGDAEGAILVIAATDDPEVNRQVWEEAEQRGQLINAVDDPPHCNVFVPAVVRRGPLTLAISTGGGAPALAARIRRKLEEEFPPAWGELIDLLAGMRDAVKERYPDDEGARRDAWYRAVDGGLLERLERAGPAAARADAEALLGL